MLAAPDKQQIAELFAVPSSSQYFSSAQPVGAVERWIGNTSEKLEI
jgi:hypothetical protein